MFFSRGVDVVLSATAANEDKWIPKLERNW